MAGGGRRGRAADAEVPARTDAYFNRTRAVVQRFGDARVTYAVFLRRPVVSAPRLMVDWLRGGGAPRAAPPSTSS